MLPERRLVVLLCGPAGAGKTTAAHASGLTVYDRDDPHWRSEATFRAALARLAHNSNARAVVIRAAASSSARAKAAQLIGATHVYVLLATKAELGHRVAHRNRTDKVHGLASIRSWFERFDQADHVQPFPGWQHVGPSNYRPLPPKPLADPRTRRPTATTTERGLGRPHQLLRANLVPAAIGTPCPGPWHGPRSPRCTRIMTNPRLMDLDDRIPRYLGGRSHIDGARICCSRCNRRAGGKVGAAITNGKRRHTKLPTW